MHTERASVQNGRAYGRTWSDTRNYLSGCLLMGLVVPLSASAIQYSTSFNCTTASTEAARVVCGNAILADMDKKISHDYNQLTATLAKAGNYTKALAYVNDSQKRWYANRDKCGTDVFCLTDVYASRVDALNGCFRSDKAMAVAEAPECSPMDRVDYDFIKKNEGSMLEFYIPGAFRANVKTGKNEGPIYKKNKSTGQLEQKAMGASGVTLGEGVDLGQQTMASLRHYMEIEQNKYGKPADVNIEHILSTAQPFVKLKKFEAVNALNDYYQKNKNSYPSLSKVSADFISSAVRHGYAEDVAQKFNKNNKEKMNFWALPSAVQTTLTDMSYHSYVPSVAKYYYAADWQGAASEFERLSTGRYVHYQSRFQQRAQMLRDAIIYHSLPASGDPCAPAKMPVAFHRSLWWENQRRLWWA
ncbi:MAG: pesticin C-terminus-like muramidase [Acidithiobacillus sp.]